MNNPTGVAEHPSVVNEIATAIGKLADAEEAIGAIERNFLSPTPGGQMKMSDNPRPTPYTTVCVSGGFDPVHIGHLRMIQEASEYGHVVLLLLTLMIG